MTSRISRFRQKMQEAAKCHREEGNGGTFDFDIRENRIPLQLAEEQIELRNAGMLEELSPEVAAIPLRLAPEQKELRRSSRRSAKAGKAVTSGQAGKAAISAKAGAAATSWEVGKEAEEAADKEKAEWLESLQAVWQKVRSVKGQNVILTVLLCAILVTAFGSSIASKRHAVATIKAQVEQEREAVKKAEEDLAKAKEEAEKEPVISFKKDRIRMQKGKTRVVPVLGEPADKTLPKLTYTSEDESVATVNDAGEITAVDYGKTHIKAVSPQGQEISLLLKVKPPSMKKTIYLTYDDGPGSKVTPKLLKVLKKYNAKATFFVIGTYAKDNKKLLKREIAEGHLVEIHTYSHDYDQIYSSTKAYMKDFNKTERLILKTTGVQPTYWRFPGGSTNGYLSNKMKKKIVKKLHKRGYKAMDWTALTGDAEGIDYSKKEMIQRGIKTIKEAEIPIVLMHDSNMKPATPAVTEAILKYFSKRGYQFKSLAEYYGDDMALLP